MDLKTENPGPEAQAWPGPEAQKMSHVAASLCSGYTFLRQVAQMSPQPYFNGFLVPVTSSPNRPKGSSEDSDWPHVSPALGLSL